MNDAHLHLILNHVPTIGSVAAVGLLLLALARRSQALTHVALELMFVIAVLTLPVYTSGAGAHREIRERAEVSETAIRLHQDVALVGFAVTELAGFVAWVGLWQRRRSGRASGSVVAATLLLSVVALAIMGRAGAIGGEIRHPEILSPGVAAAAGPDDQFIVSAIAEYVTVDSQWAWPAAEAVHFLGLSLSLGVLLAVNLRLLGVMPRVPFADVHRLLPWGMLGLGMNLITGMLFFAATPGQYAGSTPFNWKLVFLMIAAGNFLYLTEFRTSWDRGGFRASPADKAMAAGSIAAWLAVLYAGRMLPFLGRAF